MLGAVFERFVEKSPLSVMVRATLERVLSADRLDLWYERTAENNIHANSCAITGGQSV